MDDLIKREDVVKEFGRVFGDLGLTLFGVGGNDLAQVIANAIPSAEHKGEWIWSPRDTDGTVSGCCSNCSFSHLFIGGHTAQYNYCPNCGADMRGEDDGR